MTRTTIRIRPIQQALQDPGDPRYFEAERPELALRPDPARRSRVSFQSGGLELAGHLYRPPGVAEDVRTAALVLLGPISSVKEITVPHYAERLADAGYTVLTFDPRFLGESRGEPRGHYDPNLVIEDFVAAISYLVTRSDVDPDRIGVMGVCFGGGLAISAAARDRRVRAVASVAGAYAIGASFQLLLGPEKFAAYQREINDLVQHERETGETAYVPTIAKELDEDVPVAFMYGEEPFHYYDTHARPEAPTWNPQTTAAGMEPYFAYSTLPGASLLAPTPLLIVHGSRDDFCFPDFAQATYDASSGPKELVWIDAHNHVEFYDQDPYVSQAAAVVIDWLAEHLPADVPVLEGSAT